MNLSIRSPERVVYETDDAEEVLLPGKSGEIGVLPDHAPLMTPIEIGMVTVRRQEGEALLTVTGGFAEVTPEGVTVLADAAEMATEIDVDRAREAKERAEERLRAAQAKAGEVDVGRATLALMRAINRLRAVTGQRE